MEDGWPIVEHDTQILDSDLSSSQNTITTVTPMVLSSEESKMAQPKMRSEQQMKTLLLKNYLDMQSNESRPLDIPVIINVTDPSKEELVSNNVEVPTETDDTSDLQMGMFLGANRLSSVGNDSSTNKSLSRNEFQRYVKYISVKPLQSNVRSNTDSYKS